MNIQRFNLNSDDLVAHDEGEFVRFADVEKAIALLESHNEMQALQLQKQAREMEAIGAGGVSQERIMRPYQ